MENIFIWIYQDDKKLIRYREGKIVSTKGERFSQVTKEESQEMKKSIVNIDFIIWQLTIFKPWDPGWLELSLLNMGSKPNFIWTYYKLGEYTQDVIQHLTNKSFFARCLDRRSDNFAPASFSFDVGVETVCLCFLSRFLEMMKFQTPIFYTQNLSL